MIELVPTIDRENFIVNIQAAFKKAVVETYGDDGKEVIPREDVENSFAAEGAEILDIVSDGEIVGGAVVVIRPNNRNELSLLYVNVDCHSKRALGLRRGGRLRRVIRKQKFGRRLRHTLRNATCIFISTSAAFTRSSFTIRITKTRTLTNNRPTKIFRAAIIFSALKRL